VPLTLCTVSTGYVVLLAAAALSLLVSRFMFASSLRGIAGRRLSRLDALLIGVGVTGLAFHCGAMFLTSTVTAVPGTAAAIMAINAMGTASIIWYVAPAGLTLLGLRRQHPVALGALVLALAFVGLTMYDGSALSTHLRAIFVSAVVLAATVALALPVPRRLGRPRRATDGP